MFHRFLLSAASCACAVAQTTPTDIFQKAPPQLDEALRSRVSHFLQAHVDGKFRLANEVVAEDSQDAYFAMNKKRFLSYEIVKIDYTDNYTKAKVLSTVELMWRPSARIDPMRVKAPYLSMWKQENDKWVWYTVASDEWDTPFGKMKFGKQVDPEDPAAKIVNEIKTMNPQAILSAVSPNKTEVALRSWEKSEDVVEITNGLKGVITLKADKSIVSGLEITLDKTTLQPGDVAKVTFTYNPPNKIARPPSEEIIRVDPTGQTLKLVVNFALAPEIKKQLEQAK